MPSSRTSITGPRCPTNFASSASRSARRVCQLGRRHPSLQPRHPIPEAGRRGRLDDRTTTASLVGVGRMRLVGAVRHLVHDRLRVGPEPGQRPEQSAEHQREQAQRADRFELRMMALVRDLLRKDVHHPEQDDEHHRHDEEDEERDEGRELVFDLSETGATPGHPPAASRSSGTHEERRRHGGRSYSTSSHDRVTWD